MKKYCFKGRVIEGEKLGHKLGFPTANLDPKLLSPSFKKGVYSAEVSFEGDENANTKYLGVLFFGPKTVSKEINNSLEIHIFDFDKDIYKKEINVCLTEFLRGAMSFTSSEALVTQIEKDIKIAKELVVKTSI